MDWIQNEERALFDVCSTEITIDGGQTWQLLHETHEKTEAWQNRGPFDLTPYVGNYIQIRFRFDSLDSQFNDFEGWYIDDVWVREMPTPVPTSTPTETPVPPTVTPTPTPGTHGLDLILNDDMFSEGKEFHLELEMGNTTQQEIVVDTYLLLDVYSNYWYWPSWSTEVDFRRNDVLEPGKIERETILLFTWPSYDGSFDGVYIWGATLEAGTANLVGNVDNVIFGCNL